MSLPEPFSVAQKTVLFGSVEAVSSATTTALPTVASLKPVAATHSSAVPPPLSRSKKEKRILGSMIGARVTLSVKEKRSCVEVLGATLISVLGTTHTGREPCVHMRRCESGRGAWAS